MITVGVGIFIFAVGIALGMFIGWMIEGL